MLVQFANSALKTHVGSSDSFQVGFLALELEPAIMVHFGSKMGIFCRLLTLWKWHLKKD